LAYLGVGGYGLTTEQLDLNRFLSLVVSGVKKHPFVFVFLLAFVLRIVPELIVGEYPVGYETIAYYAPSMFGFRGQGLADVFSGSLGSGPVFYSLMWVVEQVSGASPFLVLKVSGAVLFGLLGVSFLLFVRRGLGLDWKFGLLAAVLVVFQIAALRESWDRFRTVLALVFLFLALVVLLSRFRYKTVLFGGLGVLTVLSREYVGVVLFAAVIGFVLFEKKDRLKSVLGLTPAVVVFFLVFGRSVGLYSYYANGAFPAGPVAGYAGVVVDVFAIFLVCYVLLLPFVVKGFFRSPVLDGMLIWLLVGSFSAVLLPFFAVPGYQRWLVLLVFPFSVYAVKGFERLRFTVKGGFWKLCGVLLVFVVAGAGYCSGAFSYVWVFGNSWVPVNMVQSSIEWGQVDDVKSVVGWFGANAAVNSSLLVEERFLGWVQIYLDKGRTDIELVPYSAGVSPPSVDGRGLSSVYLIWYAESEVAGFRSIYFVGDIGVFMLES
jgi:hypothetical protein